MPQHRLSPELHDIPETMLWALHERASEAKRRDGVLRDPRCVEIYDGLNYDFVAHFGTARRFAAVRAATVDRELRRWLARHPAGQVVSLGEGLETQAMRVDNGRMRWLSVDLPEAMQIRERFLPPAGRIRHMAASAFDPAWMEEVDARAGLIVVAQGLLMYFSAGNVRQLISQIAARFAGSDMIFDVVPHSGGDDHQHGHRVTDVYTAPAMPWRLDRNEVAPTLRAWLPGVKRLQCLPLREPTGRPDIVEHVLDVLLPRRQRRPSIVRVTF